MKPLPIVPSKYGPFIDQFAACIERQEGRVLNNNPGNIWDGLCPGKTHRIWPELPIDSRGMLIYPSLEQGREEQKHQLSLKIGRGETLSQAIEEYCPSSDPRNNTGVYIANVSQWMGNLPTTIPLKRLMQDWPHAAAKG